MEVGVCKVRDFFNYAGEIYNLLCDEESKKIYRALIDFYITGEKSYLSEANKSFMINRASEDFRSYVKRGLGICDLAPGEGVSLYGGAFRCVRC